MELAALHTIAGYLPVGDSDPGMDGEAVPCAEALEMAVARQLAEQDSRRDLPMVHPDRHPSRIDWRAALRHFRQLESDKERTHEAFHVFEALPWIGMSETACRFLSSAKGQAIYASEPSLPEILDDHATLRRHPKGSLAHAYCDHMELERLSAAGLIEEFEEWRGGRPRIDDKVEWYADRLRDTHDLLHVLSGYGRDALGEQCVLAMVFGQRPSIGHLFVGYAGAMVTRLNTRWGAPVIRSVFEARRIGRACLPIAEQAILELLPMPLETVRARLNMRTGRYYQEVRRIWRDEGVDPNQVLVKTAVA